MVTCELCGKETITTQGMRGHKTFIHGITGATEKQPVARLATEKPVSLLQDRLSKLEYITGLKDSDSEDIESDIGLPLTDIVIKLNGIVSKLSEDVGLSDSTTAAQREEFSKWLTDLQEAHNRQAAIINEHRDTFNKNFTVLGSRIDKVQKMVEDLGEGLDTTKTKLSTHGHDNLKSMPELVVKVDKFKQALDTIQSQIEYLANVARRQPTGDRAELERDDKTKHYYRKYKSALGLTNSHYVVPSFGNPYWVDLSEPDK